MALQLHNNRMGISGFAQWYPFGIKGDGGAQSKKKGGGGPYQKADENMLFRFKIVERDWLIEWLNEWMDEWMERKIRSM